MKNVPLDLRRLLAAESAANDGLAYPFLTLAIFLTIDEASGDAIRDWFLIGWLCKFFSSVARIVCSFLSRRGLPGHLPRRRARYDLLVRSGEFALMTLAQA